MTVVFCSRFPGYCSCTPTVTGVRLIVTHERERGVEREGVEREEREREREKQTDGQIGRQR